MVAHASGLQPKAQAAPALAGPHRVRGLAGQILLKRSWWW
jgi:hypothetical protein